MIIDGKEYISKKEASALLKVKLQYITELTTDGKISTHNDPKYKFKYFLKSDVDEYNESRRVYIKYDTILVTGDIKKIDKNTYDINGDIFKNSRYFKWFYVNKSGTKVYRFNKDGVFYEVNRYHDKHKHMTVSKALDGKSYTIFVHRLVLESFGFPKPNKKAVVRHLNDVPDDNRLENLKWGTQKENIRDYRILHYVSKELIKFLKEKYPETLKEFRDTFIETKIRGTKTGAFMINAESMKDLF